MTIWIVVALNSEPNAFDIEHVDIGASQNGAANGTYVGVTEEPDLNTAEMIDYEYGGTAICWGLKGARLYAAILRRKMTALDQESCS